MQVLPSTVLAIMLIGALWLIGLHRGLWLFFAALPFGAAAAFNLPAVGNASFGIKELAVIAVFGLVLFRPRGLDSIAGSLRLGQPGGVALLLFVYLAVSALWIPSIFAGMTEVFSVSRSQNAAGIVSTPLRPTAGNLTQLFTISLSLAAFLAFATHARLWPDPRAITRAMVVATVLNLGLGLLDLATAAFGVADVLDVIRTANYTILSEAQMLGMKRMIGGFPEASSYGEFSIGLFGFWLHRSLVDARPRQARAMALIALFCVIRSTSSAAYVALAILLVVYVAVTGLARTRTVLSRQIATTAIVGGLLIWLSGIAVYAAYELVGPVAAYLDQTVFEKLGSDSGIERMSWNAQAYRNLVETSLIGAGLGSARASNWLLSSLGSIGLPGTALFLVFLVSVFRMQARPKGGEIAGMVTALHWACAATLITQLLIASTPNLGVFFFTLAGLATGLARSTQVEPAAQSVLPKRRLAA